MERHQRQDGTTQTATPATAAGRRKPGQPGDSAGSIPKRSVRRVGKRSTESIVGLGPRLVRGIWFDPRPLARAAIQSGKTHRELADAVGCPTTSNICIILAGKSPTSSYMMPLCRHLGVSPDLIWPLTKPSDLPGNDTGTGKGGEGRR
jgi:hypothetical protein